MVHSPLYVLLSVVCILYSVCVLDNMDRALQNRGMYVGKEIAKKEHVYRHRTHTTIQPHARANLADK